MNRVSDSAFPKTGLELEILQQLDKIAETGNKFRDQILELGEKLKSFQEAEGQKVQKLQNQSSSTIPDWMKSMATKMQEMTETQRKLSDDQRELERRRFTLHELMAGKFEDVLKDVNTLKSWTETMKELKPKLNEERKITQDLESQIDKMTREFKGKLDLLDSAAKSNQVAVKSSLEKFRVPPPTELIDSDGWIVIQRRKSGPKEDFERGWSDYENGFGSVYGNFWLGLKKIRQLTADGTMELRVELTGWDGTFGYANYSQFSVGSSADLYRLSINEFSGTVGNGFLWQDGGQFSTKDKKTGAYAENLKGGWWKQSNDANLNGLYYKKEEAKAKTVDDFSGVYWFAWKKDYSLQKVRMKIRERK